jgi:hypothetical protein
LQKRDSSGFSRPQRSHTGTSQAYGARRGPRIVFQGIATPCSTTGWCTV